MKTIALLLMIAILPLHAKAPAPPDPKRGVAILGAKLVRVAVEHYPKELLATSLTTTFLSAFLVGFRSRAMHREFQEHQLQEQRAAPPVAK